jgi:hypothetical protein
MRTYWICYACLLLITYCNEAVSAIRNGYQPGIEGARASLSALRSMYSKDHLSTAQRDRMKAQIKQLDDFVYFFELTESRIAEFRLIAPSLFDSVNVIKDARGRAVDVYVKIVSAEQLPYGVYGVTNLAQGVDPDSYTSEYGEHTVSVKIRKDAVDLKKLAHELGHVAYQVPNLAGYVKYYTEWYSHSEADKALGHDASDMSGRSATKCEREFSSSMVSARRNR